MDKVVIVGCGVFGLSTAIELARQGREVTALDAYAVPSPWSAANDLNKIIRAEYSDMVYVKMAVEALELWETSTVYKSHFHQCGRVTMNASAASTQSQARAAYEKQSLANLARLGIDMQITPIESASELGQVVSVFRENQFSNDFSATWNPKAGYAHSSNALTAAYAEAKRLGVKFHFGEAGEAVSVTSGKVTVKSGAVYEGETILIAAGAATGRIVDLQGQIKTAGVFVSHIQLTLKEYETLKDMPVFFSAKHGYFFPPDKETHRLKFVLTYADCLNTVQDPFNSSGKITLPRFQTENPGDTVPAEAPEYAAWLLRKALPQLSDLTLKDCKVCWLSDTVDSHFLIDSVPGEPGLYVACGDSGHGFKFLPNIGKYISQRLDGTLDPQLQSLWRWKTNPAWPSQIKSRVDRPHLEISEISKWLPQ